MGAQDVFIPARQLRGSEETEVRSAELADVFPDETTGFDSMGPFLEEPTPEQDAHPAPAGKGWDNETGMQAAVFNTWGRSFCESHQVGSWCDQTTQVRCCRTSWGFVKCARASVVGRVVLGEAVLRPAVLGPFTQDGDPAPSVSLTTWAISASAIEKCTAVTTAGITWSALLSRSHPGGAEGE